MQIQRVQTLWLLLAFIAMALFCFMPFGSFMADGEMFSLRPIDEYGVLIPGAATAVLLLADVFMYKDLRSQRTVALVSALLTVCSAAVVCFLIFNGLAGYSPRFSVWGLTLPVSFVAELLAMRGMAKDKALLDSYNRLR